MQVWEFRTKEVFTKGDAVEYLFKYLLELLQTDRSQVLAIHIGDDKTDEDAFKVIILRKII
jgi:trehalose-6-phosphatase